MIGSFLTRGLVMIFGYVYPAYECFKTLERNRPDIGQLRFWCQYWILIAVITVFERVSDAFVSWVPMYSEAKLAFIIYLWCPRTKGTTYVYDSFFKPYVSKHENEIDRNLLELRTRAGDMAYMYCQKAASYGQTRVFEILQYVAAQSTPRPRTTQPTQPQQPPNRTRTATAATSATTTPATTSATAPGAPTGATTAAPRPHLTKVQATTHPQNEEPLSPTSSTSSTQDYEKEEELSSAKEASSSAAVPPSTARTFIKKAISLPITSSVPERLPQTSLRNEGSVPENSSQSASDKADAKQTVPTTKADKSPVKALPSTEETVMEETLRVTRGRLRKTRSSTLAK